MTRFLIITFVLLAHYNGKSQNANWEVYLAQYDLGPGSITLNMELIDIAPVRQLPFVVITGVTFRDCTREGFPEKEEFNNLYKISEEVLKAISSITKNELAGTFTYQCQRLDYIYVQDTLNLRKHLIALYKDNYRSYKPYLNIQADSSWEAYVKFLYPNEVALEYMSNEKVLNQLKAAGDKLNKPRLVEHWLYFKTKPDRDDFTRYIRGEGFKVEGTDFIKDSALPYQLHISRTDKIDVESISSLTLELRKKAKELNGGYDGWETVLVKD